MRMCSSAFASPRSIRFVGALLAVVACLSSSPAAAGDILITSGSLSMSPSLGPLVLEGDRGFSINAAVGASGGLLDVYQACNLLMSPCGPGDLVSLRAAWSGTDAPGSFTVDGVTYTNRNGMLSVRLEFAGSVIMPALAPHAELLAPFVFEGAASYPGVSEHLFGSGVATVTLSPETRIPGRWHLDSVVYEFGDRVGAPWVSADVGATGTPGAASSLRDFIVVSGDGADIWGNADAFRFTYQALSGAAAVVAKVRARDKVYPAGVLMSPPDRFAKAGVMIRSSSDPSAASVVLDVKPDGGLEFMARFAADEATTFIAGADTGSGEVWLRLARSDDDRVTGSYSVDGVAWTTLGTVSVLFGSSDLLAGLAVTSHEDNVLYGAVFEDARVTAEASSENLLTRGDFEAYDPPALGPPGWISDHFFRQSPAKSEYHQPHSGAKNGACWTTEYLDCGIYQEVTAPSTGTYTLRMWATADRAGGLVGADVDQQFAVSRNVDVRPFGDYREYVMTFPASAGDVIRVWMYSPAWPGYVVIDDVTLTSVAP
jgi:hypothetical protein